MSKRTQRPRAWRRHPLLLRGLLSFFLALPAASVAAPGDAPPAAPGARYPFDPVCPWGRLADGRGMLVRCLDQREAIALTAGSLPQAPASGPSEVEATGASAEADATPPEPAVPRRIVVKAVSDAKADTGSLPEARHQLGRPKDRYVQCVEQHGGLDGDSASVTVRFLVRERGRAEGVSVQSHRGLSKQAAKCIAEVVDRRYVGFPEAPIVGATLSIDLVAEPL